MIKKFILFIVVVFFVSCGSSHNVVRTTKSASVPNKTVVRTSNKAVPKQVSKPIVKNTPTPPKPVYLKPLQKNKSEETSVVSIEDSKTKNPVASEEQPTEFNQNNPQIEILEATTRVKVTTEMVLNYIEKYKSIAKEDMQQYGIPASIILGQGILESGAGTGPLSLQANNHFGIKCHIEWTGPSVRYNDDVENECFRKYKDPSESYRDHSLFLISRAHYSSLFQLDKDDYKSWAKGLKNAGYATDPAYPTKLIAIIERYHLEKYDSEVLGKDYGTSNKLIDYQFNNDLSKKSTLPNKSHQVTKGDTLYSISRKYNITIQDLKKRNNISNDTLSVGQSLIIN